jgi:hypothetical protein
MKPVRARQRRPATDEEVTDRKLQTAGCNFEARVRMSFAHRTVMATPRLQPAGEVELKMPYSAASPSTPEAVRAHLKRREPGTFQGR